MFTFLTKTAELEMDSRSMIGKAFSKESLNVKIS